MGITVLELKTAFRGNFGELYAIMVELDEELAPDVALRYQWYQTLFGEFNIAIVDTENQMAYSDILVKYLPDKNEMQLEVRCIDDARCKALWEKLYAKLTAHQFRS